MLGNEILSPNFILAANWFLTKMLLDLVFNVVFAPPKAKLKGIRFSALRMFEVTDFLQKKIIFSSQFNPNF